MYGPNVQHMAQPLFRWAVAGLALACTCLIGGCSGPAAPTTGTLSGTLRAVNGGVVRAGTPPTSPVPGVLRLTKAGPHGGLTVLNVGKNGRYALVLPPGTYVVSIKKPTYCLGPLSKTVTVRTGGITSGDMLCGTAIG